MKKIGCIFLLFWTARGFAQDQALQRRLDSLTAAYEKEGYPGVVLLARGDTILYEKGYGYANFEKKIPNTPETVFLTESVGKMFTAVAIMQLMEKGVLRPEQTVGELLPWLNIKNRDLITVHQLLIHTSGLRSPMDHPAWNWKKRYSKAELVKLVEETPLAFQTPGQSFYYSNSGYIVLSWILEQQTGEPFDQYIREHIFQPQHMTATRSLGDTLIPEDVGAQPYRVTGPLQYVKDDATVLPEAMGCGGWLSTAHDLYLFLLGLEKHVYINPATLAIMESAQGTAPQQHAYQFSGYGFEESINMPIDGLSLIGHIGGGGGFSLAAFFDPTTHYIMIHCTNIAQRIYPLTINYLNALLGRPLSAIRKLPSS